MGRSVKISKAVATLPITNTTAVSNIVTTSASLSSFPVAQGMPFFLSESIGNLVAGTQYWVLRVLTDNTFTVSVTDLSSNINFTPVTLTTATSSTVIATVAPVSSYFNNPNGAGNTYSVVGGDSSIYGNQIVVGVSFGVPGIGTISTSTSSTAITGIGTNFNTVLSAGSTVQVNGTIIGKISSVASATSATLVANATTAVSNSAYSYSKPEDGYIVRAKGQQKYLVKGLTTGIVAPVYTYNADKANLIANTCSIAVTYANTTTAYTQIVRNHTAAIFSETSGPVATGNINIQTTTKTLSSFNAASSDISGSPYQLVSVKGSVGGGGGPSIELPTDVVMLNNFSTLTNLVKGSGLSSISLGVSGNANVPTALDMQTTGNSTSPLVDWTNVSTTGMENWGVVAYGMMINDNPMKNDYGNTGMSLIAGGLTYVAAGAFSTNRYVQDIVWYSKKITSFMNTGQPLATLVGKPATMTMRFSQNLSSGARDSGNKLFAAVRNANVKSNIILTFDDAPDSQYTHAFSYMSARNMVGTLYLPVNKVNTTSMLTTAHCNEMYAAGWSMANDGTRDDASMCNFETVAEAITELNANRQFLVSQGWLGAENHLCYPFGTMGMSETSLSYTMTVADQGGGVGLIGVVPTPGAALITPGQSIKSPTISGPRTVKRSINPTTIEFTTPLPAGSHVTAFLSTTLKLITVNSSTPNIINISDSNTTAIQAGQDFCAIGVPDGVTVVSVDDTAKTATLSTNVPTTLTSAAFTNKSAPFFYRNLQTALLNAGYLSGRGTFSLPNYTGFGMTPKRAITLSGMSTTSQSLSVLTTAVDLAVADCTDLVMYFHGIETGTLAMPNTTFQPFIDYLVTLRDAGTIDVPNIQTWWNKVSNRSMPAI